MWITQSDLIVSLRTIHWVFQVCWDHQASKYLVRGSISLTHSLTFSRDAFEAASPPVRTAAFPPPRLGFPTRSASFVLPVYLVLSPTAPLVAAALPTFVLGTLEINRRPVLMTHPLRRQSSARRYMQTPMLQQ
jgi:hypothetical protein